MDFGQLLTNLQQTLGKAFADPGALHPFMVHFPVALLFIVPLFILAGLFIAGVRKAVFAVTLVLMFLGIAGLFLSVSTGNMAAENLTPDPAYLETLEKHLELGEQALVIFSVLTAVFLLVLLAGHFRPTEKIQAPLTVLFLLLYGAALILLFNTAHYGGELVHRHGLTSSIYRN